MTADDRLLTTEDLAAMLRLPKRTVADWRQRSGGPPAVKIGRHVRYRPADVEAWLTSRTAPQLGPDALAALLPEADR